MQEEVDDPRAKAQLWHTAEGQEQPQEWISIPASGPSV